MSAPPLGPGARPGLPPFGATPPPSLDLPLGSLLIASWVNMMLFTLELIQAWDVIVALPSGRRRLQLVLVGIVGVDLLGTTGACAQIYLDCVSFWGNFPALATTRWPYPLVIGTTAVTAAIVHGYLIRRMWILSRNLFVVVPLALLAILALAGAVWTVVALVRYPLVAQQAHWTLASRVWGISSAAADILLAAALVWKLRQVRSPHKETQTILRRLMLMAVESGALTATLFIVTIILLLSVRDQPAAVGVELCLGRAYANTLLYNLQVRKRVNSTAGSSRTAGGDGAAPISLSGIQVARTVTDHVDMDEADEETAGHSSTEETRGKTARLSAHPGSDAFDYPPQPGSSRPSSPAQRSALWRDESSGV